MKNSVLPGAHDRNRTGDLFLTKEVLYRLSYVGTIIIIIFLSGAGDGIRTRDPQLGRLTLWPAELLPHSKSLLRILCLLYYSMVERGGFEPPKAEPTDLQSAPFGHSGTSPEITSMWSWRWDLNPQPADYKSAALPLSYASIFLFLLVNKLYFMLFETGRLYEKNRFNLFGYF